MNTDKLRYDIELQNDFVKLFPLDSTDFSEQYQEIFAWFIGKKTKLIHQKLKEQEARHQKRIEEISSFVNYNNTLDIFEVKNYNIDRLAELLDITTNEAHSHIK